MSYSRWSHSEWYTFWHVHPRGKVETRDNAIFDICGLMTFTAKELREDLEACLEKVHEKQPNGNIEELKLYIKRFLEDVEEEFPADL